MNENVKQPNYSPSVAEQEVHISWMRDEDFAKIYASDSTAITRLDKLCRTSPRYV